TLAHELAHIWLGASGVSDLPTSGQKGIEQLCNEVAADLLVPRDEFSQRWAESQDIEALARFFRVSRLVVARRALDLGKINQDAYDAIARQNYRPKARTGGDGLRNTPVRNSRRFTRTVVASAMSGQTLLREAAGLLNSKPDTIVALWRKEQSNG